jgi:ATP-dependent helicase Lhr and Lhr-like helicase
MGVLSSFHPAVRRWFEGRFPDGPSAPQESGWPSIAKRQNTLIAAPTGSGKTLAAFLVCIDEFYRRTLPDTRFGCDADRPFRLEPDPIDPAPRRVRRRRAPETSIASGAEAGDGDGAAMRPRSTPDGVEVLYVSPLKALAADIQENLATPLREIDAIARGMGLPAPEIRVGMRSGDTPASARAAMLKKPPQILVTTPESLYLLLTSARGREILRPVRTVIVDEIHAMARDKRGSHLAVSLERLEALCDEPPTRIGLSATQKPIETVARLLVGVGPDRVDAEGRARCEIVDKGHRRTLDLATVLPGSELEAVASGEQMAEILDRIAAEVHRHQTTLIFVNTRRMAERLAHQLAEKLADDASDASDASDPSEAEGDSGANDGRGARAAMDVARVEATGEYGDVGVAAHHGSLSKNRRLRVESALREGRLRALVATASLELGIDVGPVELVCQIGSPRSLATFLQRVGRSGHFRGGIPKGRLYPMTRDELVECAGLLRGIRAGRLDRLLPPQTPLDILAQQIVAACAAEPWKEEDLYQLMIRSAPFEHLTREVFEEVVELVSEGIETGRGRRAAYVHRDRIGGMLRSRRGARLAALTSGGAIPDVADYRVVADPDETFIGTVGEDFAVDSLPGDVFLLGSTPWRIRRLEAGVLRVVDADGAQPNIPFWAGEAPARTEELSDEVSSLREDLEPLLVDGDEAAACRFVEEETGVGADAALQIVRYLGVSRAALGGLPTRERLVLERFFDEAGGMQLVIHSPRGGRLNRALCLALRKKFCKSFNFELQAAANDDAMVLSLGPHHSFPLEDVPHFLSSKGIEATLSQAVLPTPLFTARWRWNLNRSLAVLRFRGGKKNPAPIQRMESDDLMAAVFPQAAACQENVSGPIEIPDHVLVRQTLHDCMTDAMDAKGLERLVERIEEGSLEIRCVDTTEPSPLSHEILNGKPFTYLDDAPLEERRTRAVKTRRGLPVEERDLTQLDAAAIEKVRAQAEPSPRDAEELHDLLLGVGALRADPRWQRFFHELEAMGRAFHYPLEASETSAVHRSDGRSETFWAATERAGWARALHGSERMPFAVEASSVSTFAHVEGAGRPLAGESGRLASDAAAEAPEDALDVSDVSEDVAIAHVLRGHLETTGPIDVATLAARVGVRTGLVEIGLAALEAEGFVLRGCFEGSDPGATDQFCARRLLARIHADSQSRLRASVETISAQDFMRFLFEWQRVAPGAQYEGPRGVACAIEQLQGFDLAAGAWESDVLRARVEGYRPEWLDGLCLSGQISWIRLATPTQRCAVPSTSADEKVRIQARATSRSTPLSLVLRGDLGWLLQAHRPEAGVAEPVGRLAESILGLMEARGALFHSQLVAGLGERPVDVESALWELVAHGRVGADGFQALRSLLGARARASKTRADRRARRGLRRGLMDGATGGAEGRWSMLPQRASVEDLDGLAEAVAEQLLARWGIVFRDVVLRENLALPWREIVWALRRLEARGVIRGGRFVSGFTGEQFALPSALETLARVRRTQRDGQRVIISGSDPLNLVGILTPGRRVPALQTRRIVFVDGRPMESEPQRSEYAAESAVARSVVV